MYIYVYPYKELISREDYCLEICNINVFTYVFIVSVQNVGFQLRLLKERLDMNRVLLTSNISDECVIRLSDLLFLYYFLLFQ